MNLAIITPTFNRQELLGRLYDSLCRQTTSNFVWIIVDDGSEDSTEDVVSQWMEKGNLSIRYLKVPNGGKSRALNRGFVQNKDIDFFAIVDSDDTLLEDGVEKISDKAREYMNMDTIGSIMFNYKDSSGATIGSNLRKFCRQENIATFYEHTNRYDLHDGCIGYFARVVSTYEFPEYRGEKYLGPTVLQMQIAEKFKTVFSPIVVGIAEYQAGGITRSGRSLRLRNPLGMMKYCELKQSRMNANKLERIKYAIGSHAYLFASGMDKKQVIESGIDRRSFKIWAYWPGRLLRAYWTRK